MFSKGISALTISHLLHPDTSSLCPRSSHDACTEPPARLSPFSYSATSPPIPPGCCSAVAPGSSPGKHPTEVTPPRHGCCQYGSGLGSASMPQMPQGNSHFTWLYLFLLINLLCSYMAFFETCILILQFKSLFWLPQTLTAARSGTRAGCSKWVTNERLQQIANRTAPVICYELTPCKKLTGKRGGRVALLHSFPISWSRLRPCPSTSEEMSISTLVTEPFINSTQGNEGQSRRKKTTHQH